MSCYFIQFQGRVFFETELCGFAERTYCRNRCLAFTLRLFANCFLIELTSQVQRLTSAVVCLRLLRQQLRRKQRPSRRLHLHLLSSSRRSLLPPKGNPRLDQNLMAKVGFKRLTTGWLWPGGPRVLITIQ